MTITSTTVGLIPGYFPPSRENYDLILSLWKWYPAFASLQWLVSFYGMGKTSLPSSRLNIPGRVAWLTMESPGFISLLYTFNSLSSSHEDLPWQNKVLAALFVIHYTYRALLFPFLQPSMSPIHFTIWVNAIIFQVVNGSLIGSYLGAYGPTTASAWSRHLGNNGILQFAVGIAVFYVGLAANYYHDEELREIRRREIRRQKRLHDAANGKGNGNGKPKGVDKHYEIPKAGLFKYVLYPHYLMEWIEWFGFWMAAGWGCVPARCFLVNEVTAMLPRAVKGKQWYIEKFGEEKIGKKWAVIPGVW